MKVRLSNKETFQNNFRIMKIKNYTTSMLTLYCYFRYRTFLRTFSWINKGLFGILFKNANLFLDLQIIRMTKNKKQSTIITGIWIIYFFLL